jgi:hypothetical protein
MSVVNTADSSTPASIKADPTARCKSSEPEVTFTNVPVVYGIFCKPANPVKSEDAQFVRVRSGSLG